MLEEKNVIKKSGYMIYPEEMENKILKIQNVKEISIQGIFVENINNEKIIYFVILKADNQINRDSFRIKILKVLNYFQLPDKIIFLKEFPKTSLGKISKPALIKLI